MMTTSHIFSFSPSVFRVCQEMITTLFLDRPLAELGIHPLITPVPPSMLDLFTELC